MTTAAEAGTNTDWLDESDWRSSIHLDGWRAGGGGSRAVVEPATGAANELGLQDLRTADRGSNVRSKGGDGYTPLGPELLPAAGRAVLVRGGIDGTGPRRQTPGHR